jgi:uncharacterized membrane protein
MALAAAEQQHGALDEDTAETVKAYSAATDNVGLFFGEDIFIAIGSIILIQATLATYGYDLAPLELAIWAIPTAIAAFLIHGVRLLMLDRRLGGRTPFWLSLSKPSRSSGPKEEESPSTGSGRTEPGP